MVLAGVRHDAGVQDGLVLHDVQVDEAGPAVIEDGSHDVVDLAIRGGCARGAPAHDHELGLVAQDVLLLGGGDRLFGFYGMGRQVLVGLPVAEVFLDDLDHFVRVEVAGEADRHVVRNVVGVLLLADGLQGRVLQVVLRADDRLRAVRVVREEKGVEGVERFLAVVGQAHVLFLVHGLQLGVEPAEDAVHEAVGLDLRPVLDLVGRDFLHVAGYVVGRVGVGAPGADDGHQFVIFVRNRDLGRLVADGVDFMVDRQPLLGIGLGAVHFKQAVDGLEHRLFGRVVLGTETLGALEHHVLEVVGETGIVGGIVLAARADGHVGLDAGLVLVDGHVHFQAVGEGVDLCLHRISLHGLVLVAACHGNGGDRRQEDEFFHIGRIEYAKIGKRTECQCPSRISLSRSGISFRTGLMCWKKRLAMTRITV